MLISERGLSSPFIVEIYKNMLDIKFIRENKEIVQAGADKKNIKFDVSKLLEVDDKRKKLLVEVESKRAEQNKVSEEISQADNPVLRRPLIESMQELKADLQKKEDKLKEVLKEWQMLMVQVPNIPDISVPEGKDDTDNQEVHQWGEKPSFGFSAKDHIELMQLHDMVDLERGVKVAGFRGYFLKNDGVLLSQAIWNFVTDLFVKKGYTPMFAPSMVRREPLIGTGYFPQGEDDLYKTQDESYLAGTAEVATMGYYMDEVLDKNDLPIKILSFSPCFRREAGSHGRDTKGLMRVHEFYKLEQVILCEARHEESVRHHEEITLLSEEMLQKLGIPYRVVINCGGDIGLGQVKKYDIESWVPSENKYRETHSSSYFHDFQSRRLNIKYRDTDGKIKFVHSLNNTAVATPRILISLVENYQKADGSIVIPEPLRPYIGKDVISKARPNEETSNL
jgi:seryl-tRNA synthetase